MLLRPPQIVQQNDNLSHIHTQSDARQSSKSKSKIKKKQNSLSFRNKPIHSQQNQQKQRDGDNVSVHSHASRGSKKSKKKQSSLGFNKQRGGYITANSPRKSNEEEIQVMDYAEIIQKPERKNNYQQVQHSQVKRDYAAQLNYSPQVHENRSPNIVDNYNNSNKKYNSFKDVIYNVKYENEKKVSSIDEDDEIPVVKLIEGYNNKIQLNQKNNVNNMISPKIAEKKQTRKLGRLFEQSRRNLQNASQLGVSGVPSQIGNSSVMGGDSRRSKSKLGQLFKQKSKQKQISNSSLVSFTQNASQNYNNSLSDLNLNSNFQTRNKQVYNTGNRSKQKQNIQRYQIPEKVLQENFNHFSIGDDAYNRSQLNLSLSRNSPFASHLDNQIEIVNNKDSVCFNLEPERRKKGLGLASKMKKEQDQIIKISGNLASKDISNFQYPNSNPQQNRNQYITNPHQRLRNNFRQNQKYLQESGVNSFQYSSEVQNRQQEQLRRQQQAIKIRQKQMQIEKAIISQKKKQQALRQDQRRKQQQDRIQQENQRREAQILRKQEQTRKQQRKKQQERRRKQQQQRFKKQQQIERQRTEKIQKQRQHKIQQQRKKQQREKQKQKQAQQQIQKQTQRKLQNQKRKQKQRLIQRQKERQKQILKQQIERKQLQLQIKSQQYKIKKQSECQKQRKMLAYKQEQQIIMKNNENTSSKQSLIYELDNQSLNEKNSPKYVIPHQKRLSNISKDYSQRQSSKSQQSRKSTRKKEGIIARNNRKHFLAEASPRAQESFYESSQYQTQNKISQNKLQLEEPLRKLMSFDAENDMGYEPKNKTDSYFYDKSSKAYSKPPLSKKSSSKSKPKDGLINKKPSKDSTIQTNQTGIQNKATNKKLNLIELAMKKNYQPESGSQNQSQDSFRSRQNSANSSRSRNSINSRGSKKKQSVIRIKQNNLANRPPLYRKNSSQNQDNMVFRTAKHQKQVQKRLHYAEIEKQLKPTVVKGCTFIDQRGRLVENANLVIRGSQVSSYGTKNVRLTQQKFIERLMNSRQKRRSRSRQRSLNRSRASSKSNQKCDSRHEIGSINNLYTQSQAYSETQESQSRRYQNSRDNFYNSKNNQTFFQNYPANGSRTNNFGNTSNYRPSTQHLQQFIKPIQQVGNLNKNTQKFKSNQINQNIKKRTIQRTQNVTRGRY